MKKILMSVAALVMATSVFADKIGVVDSQKAFANFSLTKQAQKSLENQAKGLENEARQKEVMLQKEQVSLQAKGDKITDQEKQSFQKKVEAYQSFLNSSQEKLSKEQYDKLKKIDDILTKAINKVAADGKYDLIVEKAAVRFGGTDITDQVSKEMEKLK